MPLRVRFDRPPVVEVVCGVQFSTEKPFASATSGKYWRLIEDEFPTTADATPLAPAIESAEIASIEFEILSMPPIRRAWFVSRDGKHLIQVQGDRFIFNWKDIGQEEGYPSFDVVMPEFEKHFTTFRDFLTNFGNPIKDVKQFELTYVNHISKANGLDIVEPYNVLVDHRRKDVKGRFLPPPETFKWTSSYLMPNGSGRLHVVAQTARRNADGEPIVSLEFTARGVSGGGSDVDRHQWFNLAHDWITFGFADSTDSLLHSGAWGRTQ